MSPNQSTPSRASFFTYFTSSIGIICMLTFLFSVVTKSKVNIGGVGLFWVPFIAVVYAFWRWTGPDDLETTNDDTARPRDDEKHGQAPDPTRTKPER